MTAVHRCESWLRIGGSIGRLETFRMTPEGQLCRVRLVAVDGSCAGYVEDLASRFRPAAPPAFAAHLVSSAGS